MRRWTSLITAGERETLQAAMGDRLTFLISGPTMIDVMAHGVDKGSGIRFFRDYWGIAKEECMALAVNARETMGGLFLANPCEMTDADCAGVFEKAYR